MESHWSLAKQQELVKALKSLAGYEMKNASIALVRLQSFPALSINLAAGTLEAAIQRVQSDSQKLLQGAYIIRFSFDTMLLVCPDLSEKTLKSFVNRVTKKITSDAMGAKRSPCYLRFHSSIASITHAHDLEQGIWRAIIALHYAENSSNDDIIVYKNIKKELCRYEDHLAMATYFLRALKSDRLVMAYQPVVDAATSQAVSYEALLRIVTDDGELMSAGPFILVAEQFGFIHHIDIYVLHKVVEELKLSNKVVLALNISSLTIDNKDWLGHAKKLLKDPCVAARLIIELTETALSKDSAVVMDFVKQMKKLGCKIAIDDFGSGYTSFKQLKILQADILKIDGFFVRDINHNPDSKLFVEMLLKFGTAYKLKTVAEFVESEEIASTLTKLGIDCMQGYYFGKAEQQRAWLK